MTESTIIILEISFNSFYLISIWGLVILMFLRRDHLAVEDQKTGTYFRWSFFLLALGDSFHVGSRILGYLSPEGLDLGVQLLGRTLGVVGWSALATALTVTGFYVLFLLMGQERFGQKLTPWLGLLYAAAAVRILLLFLPQNQWDQTVPVQPWSLIRNIPLMVVGFGAVYFFLTSSREAGDKLFSVLGWLILASYAFYIPVILFVQQIPMLGMLMIPKTIAYLGMAVVGYQTLYTGQPQLVQGGSPV